MHIRLVDGKIQTTPGMRSFVFEHLGRALHRFAHNVREVCVTIRDVNGPRGGRDKRCSITAIVAGSRPGMGGTFVAVRRDSTDFHAAIAAATDALKRAVTRRLGEKRPGDHRRRSPRSQTRQPMRESSDVARVPAARHHESS